MKKKAIGKKSSGAKIKKALQHADILGAGARKRKSLNPKEKIHTVMKEFKRGTLHSGSGGKVKNRKQAIAIGLSEARRAGAKIKKPRDGRAYLSTQSTA